MKYQVGDIIGVNAINDLYWLVCECSIPHDAYRVCGLSYPEHEDPNDISHHFETLTTYYVNSRGFYLVTDILRKGSPDALGCPIINKPPFNGDW